VNPQVASYLAVAVATVAVFTDLRSRRIPNWLTLSVLCTGLLVQAVSAGAPGVASALIGSGLGLGVLLPFYLLHVIGAGDVKLLAALGALLGPQVLVSVAVYGAIVGGVCSVLILARSGRLMVTLHELFVRHVAPSPSGARAPYAIAIAGGVYLAMVLPSVV
jgi:prepilin peptidase CpaA